MTGWIVLLAILLVLVLIGAMPLGIDASGSMEDISVAIRVGFLSIRPGSKGKKEKGPTEEKEEQTEKKRRIPFAVIKLLMQNGYHTLSRLIACLRVRALKIHFTSAFSDPSVTAMAYAAAGVAMDGLLRMNGSRIAHPDLRATVDFDSETPALDFHIRVILRVHQTLREAFGFGFRFLRDYLRYKKEDGKHGKSDQ